MRMWRWSIVLIVGVVLCGTGLWVSVRAALHQSVPEKPASKPQPSIVDQREKDSPKEHPRAVADETFHNFGILDPNQACEHSFVIRNKGKAPLKLTRGETSCKCTVSSLPHGEVPPGGEVPVTVASKVNDVKGEFTHSATILTNDPETSRIDLRIAGKVRTILAAVPSEVTVRCNRRRPALGEVVVYSEVWDHFSLKIEPLKDVTFEIEPADSSVIQQLGARCAQRIRVNLPPREESGFVSEHLQITATPSSVAEGSPRSLTVNLLQITLKPIAFHGDKFNSVFKELQFGPLRPREGAQGRVVLVVRDEQRELTVRKIEVRPEFMKVEMKPLETEKDKPAVFAIDVEIPKNAPSCNYLTEKATVLIETDHPEVQKIEFKVSFAVISQ